MTYVAIGTRDGGAPRATAADFPGVLQRFHAEWTRIVYDRSAPVLARALAVAALLSLGVVAALLAQPDDSFAPAPKTRAVRLRTAATPFMTLSREAGDFPLDSDFSLEQAARTWGHRLNAREEADPAGIMRFGPVKVSRSIVERVVQAAKTTETDPALLMAIAEKESNFAPKAKASTSSASGLFQFIERTWIQAVRAFGERHGHDAEAKAIGGDEQKPVVLPQKRSELLKLRNDPYLSAVLAAEMLKHDGAKISERIGRNLTPGETYLIHFLGPDDAARFMQKLKDEPQSSAAQLLPRPARANKPIFYAQEGRKRKDKTVGEVHEAFESMMGKRTSRYEDVEARLPADAMAYTGR